MLRERDEVMKIVFYAVELALVSLNFLSVYFLFSNLHLVYRLDVLPETLVIRPPAEGGQYFATYWVALFLWAVILRRGNDAQQFRLELARKIVSRYFVNGVFFFGLFTSAAFLFKFQFMSRAFILLYTGTTVVVLILNRFAALAFVHSARKKGKDFRNLLLVGTGKRAQQFISLLGRHNEWGYRLVGLLDMEKGKQGERIAGYPVVGTLDDLPRLLEQHVVDEVVFVVPRSWIDQIEKCILYCEAVGVPATLSTDFFNLDIASGKPRSLDNFTYITFETRLLKAWELVIKRVCDVVGSGILLVILAPLFALMSVLVLVTSRGAIFFRQIRVGRNGRKFVLYKFRSMVEGAEAQLAELREKNEMAGPVFKITDDPRITKLGKFLRMTSIDELPQLFNVLKGDMSLVGPRPPLPHEVDQYEPWQRRRLSMKPGITCIWQISGRNKIGFEDWMKLDLQYIDRWTLWLDFKILLKTVWVVLTRSGAR